MSVQEPVYTAAPRLLPPLPRRPASCDEFEIGIICALVLEADAIDALFDHHWDDDSGYSKSPGDPNAYSTGVIGRHNVVLAHMAGMGKKSAASVAAYFRASFPNIKLAIIVGICGAVPFTSDGSEIVLGDVIISDGIIEHDFGRQLPNQFVRKDTLLDVLGRPNLEIRSLLAKLRTRHCRIQLQKRMENHMKTLRHAAHLGAHYPGRDYDRLFEAKYSHAGDKGTCEQVGCRGQLVTRLRLERGQRYQPAVHFGLMASGDTVVKSGVDLDRIADGENVIGFEMESAGIWDNLPCVVIKGACDYADSHKQKRWQAYAAATAAAFTKAFLEYWQSRTKKSGQDVVTKSSSDDISSGLQDARNSIARVILGDTLSELLEPGIEKSVALLFKKKSPRQHFQKPAGQLYTQFSAGLSESASRVIHTSVFEDWMTGTSRLLWYAADDEEQQSPVLELAKYYRDEHAGSYVMYYDCAHNTVDAGKESGRDRSKLLPITVCLSFITFYLRLRCHGVHDRRLDYLHLSLKELQEHGLDIQKLWRAYTSPMTPINVPMDELARLLELPNEAGSQAILVIDNLEHLDTNGLAQFLRLLRDISSKGPVLLSGRNTQLFKRTLPASQEVSSRTEYEECLKSLYFEQLHLRRDRVVDAENGTNNWIFQHESYKNWYAQKSGVLWVEGKPGSGKSVLAKSLVDRIVPRTSSSQRLDDSPVASWFYSRRDGAISVSHASMFRSILFQLLKEHKLWSNTIMASYRRKPSHRSHQDSVWSLAELQHMMKDAVASGQEMICVIDGYDEAEDGEESGASRETLLDMLLQLTAPQLNSCMKFAVLSRPSADIARSFYRESDRTVGQDDRRRRYSRIVLQNENHRDIETLVAHGIRELQDMVGKSFNEPQIAQGEGVLASVFATMRQAEHKDFQDIRDYILSKANGVILWVALVLQTLQGLSKFGGIQAFELKEKLYILPPDLKDLYKYMRRDLEEKLPLGILNKAKAVLMWCSIASTRRAMTLEELWDALAIPPDVTEAATCSLDPRTKYGVKHHGWAHFRTILNNWCGPFVEVIGQTKKSQLQQYNTIRTRGQEIDGTAVVQLLHQTVKEFLNDPEASASLYCGLQEAERFFLQSCQHYVTILIARFQFLCNYGPEFAASCVSYLEDKCLLLYCLRTFVRDPNDDLQRLYELTRLQHDDSALRDVVNAACSSRSPRALECLLRLTAGSYQGHARIGVVMFDAVLKVAVQQRLTKHVRTIIVSSRNTVGASSYRLSPRENLVIPRINQVELHSFQNKAYAQRNWDLYCALMEEDSELLVALGSKARVQALLQEVLVWERRDLRITVLKSRVASSRATFQEPNLQSMESPDTRKRTEACINVVLDLWMEMRTKCISNPSTPSRLRSRETLVGTKRSYSEITI